MSLFHRLFTTGNGNSDRLGLVYRYPKIFTVLLLVLVSFVTSALDALDLVDVKDMVWIGGIALVVGFFVRGILRYIHDRRRNEVSLTSHYALIFSWPIILMGFIFPYLRNWEWFKPETLGWIYAATIAIVFLTVAVNLGRNVTVFWAVLITGLFFAVRWFTDFKGVQIFHEIWMFLKNIDPNYEGGLENLGYLLSLLLVGPFCSSLILARLDHGWRVTHNEIQQYSWFRRVQAHARGAKTIIASYPDLLEAILGLAGTILVMDATGTRIIERIEHVTFLPFRMRRIDTILETTQVTTLREEELAAATADDGHAEDHTTI